MQLGAPELRRNRDCRHMPMPPLANALRFAQNVAHALPPRGFRHQAVFRPLCQVLEVERQVVLHAMAEILGRHWVGG
jgi:hypothetical protein